MQYQKQLTLQKLQTEQTYYRLEKEKEFEPAKEYIHQLYIGERVSIYIYIYKVFTIL